MNALKKGLLALAAAALAAGTAGAATRPDPQCNFGGFDHVFLIMMENQTNTDILGNPNAPFINQYAATVNQATDYFAVGHPSAPNYLEITGGSNFGLTGDYWPVWTNGFRMPRQRAQQRLRPCLHADIGRRRRQPGGRNRNHGDGL